MVYKVQVIDGWDGEQFVSQVIEWAPCEQRDNLMAVSSPRRRLERAAVYDLLVRLMRDNGLLRSLPIIAYGAHGKPLLTNYPDLQFNVSHCRQAVAVAIDVSASVGVDIECRRKVSDELMHRVCNDDELRMIALSEDPAMSFLRLWTQKEAYLKCVGTGISCDLRTLFSGGSDAHWGHMETHFLPDCDGFISICLNR